MADERISQLQRLPKDAAAATDVLPIVDISASQTKKIQLDDLVAAGVDLIPSGEIDLSKLDQSSATKLGASAIASGAITAAQLADDSSVVVDTATPSGDTFDGRGYFNSSTGNLQIFNGSSYQQVVMPSGGIGDLQVITAKLADGAVTTAKVSPLGSAAYASGSVGTAALASGAVTAEKIASGTITAAQFSAGAVNNAALGSAAVTYDKIQSTASGNVLLGAVSSGTIVEIPCTAAGRAVLAAADTTEQRAALGLGTLAEADGTWVDGSTVDGTCTGTNTGDQTITLTGDVTGTGTGSFAVTIANGVITEAKIVDGAITENKIADGAITSAKFDDDSSTIVATSVPIGNGAFVGQQWVNVNTGWEYTWTGTEWLRLQSIADITFDNSSPFTFSAALTDPFTAEITIGQTVQPAAQVLAGPVSGADAAPAYRALVPSDLPVATSSGLGAASPGAGLSAVDGVFNHSNAIASGTVNGISFDGQGHITAASGLAATDIPSLDASKIATGQFGTERYADDSITGAKLADYSTAQIGETLPVAQYTGQIFFNPLTKSFFLWDGNVWQPVGVSIGGIEFAGTYNASGNTVISTTDKGQAAGLAAGSGLPAASDANKNYYVVVASGGTGTSPAPAVALVPPDIILSDGNGWVEIDVSTSFSSQSAAQISFAPAGQVSASNVQAAIEEVSSECRDAGNIASGTLAVARGGTNISSYTKGDFIVASGATVLSKLGVGTNGQTLVADSTADLGVRWGTVSGVGTVTSVSSTTAALVVASGTSTTTPSLSIASASTSASGVVMLTDSTSTTSSVLAATATAVKAVADVANGALQASGSTVTGQLRIGTAGSLVFEGSIDDANKTTFAVANPTASRTITFPNETGTVITSAGSGVVTSVMILDGTIVNADINANAAIALTKLANGALPSGITVASVNIVDGTIVDSDISSSAAIALSKLATGALPTAITVASANIVDGTIVDADISNSAAINPAKISGIAVVSGDARLSNERTPVDGSVTNAKVASGAAIELSKLATGALPSGITVASVNIADGTIVDADVNASAAIAGTKISPNFGDQAIATTSSATAGRVNVIDSTIPQSGLFRPADTILGFSAGTREGVRLFETGGLRQFSNASASTAAQFTSANGAGTSNNLIAGLHSATSFSDGTTSFVVRTNGNVLNTNNSYGSLSDEKLKENIVDASSQWADIKAIRVRNYNFKEGQKHKQIGVVAQEVETVCPGLVTSSPDRDDEGSDLGTETKAVSYSVLFVKAVKALQEAMARIETLESEVAALKR